LYWRVFYILDRELAREPLPAPYSKVELEVTVYAKQMRVDRIITELAAMGELCRREIESQLDRGDMVAIAYAAGEPAGYGWLGFSSGKIELAFGITWMVRPHEAVGYGNFVPPKWRGRGIQRSINAAVNSYARGLGITRSLSSISALNTQSMSLAKHYGSANTMKVTLIHIRPANRTIIRASGSPFDSRFIRPE
jgi:GNAT superfamily N-acetyltransferase